MIVNKGEEMKKYFLCIYAMLLAFSLGHTITFVHAEETEVPAATVQTGWVTTEDGHKQWLDENGIAVIGWRDIDNFMYYLITTATWKQENNLLQINSICFEKTELFLRISD